MALKYIYDRLQDYNINFFVNELVEAPNPDKPIGKYKINNNQIKNGAGTVVFTPPTVSETKKYMNELIDFINSDSNIHPLMKAAIIHSQFESIHPFAERNVTKRKPIKSMFQPTMKAVFLCPFLV